MVGAGEKDGRKSWNEGGRGGKKGRTEGKEETTIFSGKFGKRVIHFEGGREIVKKIRLQKMGEV